MANEAQPFSSSPPPASVTRAGLSAAQAQDAFRIAYASQATMYAHPSAADAQRAYAAFRRGQGSASAVQRAWARFRGWIS